MNNSINQTSVSFSHISDDVVVPTDALKAKRTITVLTLASFAVFGIGGLVFVLVWGMSLLASAATVAIFLGVAGFVSRGASVEVWLEIDRKNGKVRRWSGVNKKREMPPIAGDAVRCKATKQLTSVKYLTEKCYIMLSTSDPSEKCSQTLFVLPKDTHLTAAEGIAIRVQEFVQAFLAGKSVKPKGNQYTITA